MLVLYVGLYASSVSFYREGYVAAFNGKPNKPPIQMRVANTLNLPAVKVASLLVYLADIDRVDRVVPAHIPIITPILAWGGAVAAYHFTVMFLLLVMWYFVGRWIEKLTDKVALSLR